MNKELKEFTDHGKVWMADESGKYGERIMSDENIENYEKDLKDRIQFIEDAIDNHLEILLKTT